MDDPLNIEQEIAALEAEAGADPAVLAAQSAAQAEADATAQAVADSEKEYRELLQPVLYLGFKTLAPAWEVSHAEAEALAAGYAPLLQKYFPDGPMRFGPEIGAALVTAAIIAPRLGRPRKAPPVDAPAANDPDHGPAIRPPEKPGDDVQVDPGVLVA